jgi:hypothetical protein
VYLRRDLTYTPVETVINRFTHVVKTISFTPKILDNFKLDLSCPLIINCYEKLCCPDCKRYILAVVRIKN